MLSTEKIDRRLAHLAAINNRSFTVIGKAYDEILGRQPLCIVPDRSTAGKRIGITPCSLFIHTPCSLFIQNIYCFS